MTLTKTVTNILSKRVTDEEAKQFALNNYGILAKSYGGFQKNDRRQTMIFYSDLYFKTILGYTIPSAQAN